MLSGRCRINFKFLKLADGLLMIFSHFLGSFSLIFQNFLFAIKIILGQFYFMVLECHIDFQI